MKESNVEAIYPLTDIQAGILFHSLYRGQSDIYCNQLRCQLRGPLEVSTLVRAWRELVKRHEAFRTLFVWEDRKKPLQLVQREVELPVNMLDFQDLSEEARAQALDQWLAQDRGAGFDLGRAPLMRLAFIRTGVEEWEFVWSHHHLLLDGWSLSVVFEELTALYKAMAAGARAELPRPTPLREYVKFAAAQNGPEAERYWRRRLAGFSRPTTIPILAPGAEATSQRNEVSLKLGKGGTDALLANARRQRVTFSTLVQAAWALLVGRHAHADDVIFGTTVSGRPPGLEGAERIVGLCINTVPVRARLASRGPVFDWIRELQAGLVEQQAHQQASLLKIQGWSELPRGQALFDSLVVTENYPLDTGRLDFGTGVKVGEVSIHEKTNYALTLIAVPGAELAFRLLYDPERVDEVSARALLTHYLGLIQGLAFRPEAKLEDLPALPFQIDAERTGNDPSAAPQRNDTRVDVAFKAQAEKAPEAIACESNSRATCYRELYEDALRIAGALRDRAVPEGARVAVAIGRSHDQLAAVLGSFFAGCACVLVHGELRREQCQSLSERLALRFWISATNQPEAASRGELLQLDAGFRARLAVVTPPPATGSLESVAYLAQGQEQTEIEHRALAARVFRLRERLQLSPDESVSVSASVRDELWLRDALCALVSGSKIRIEEPAPSTEPQVRPGGDVWELSDREITALLTEGAGEAAASPQPLRAALCTDASASASALELLAAKLGCSVHQFYSMEELGSDVAARCFRAGTPEPAAYQSDALIWILDRFGSPAPSGVIGEVWLERVPGARGSALDRATRELGGRRLLRTGELGGRRGPELVLSGDREDHARVNGYPLSLSELELQLSHLAPMAECAVLARASQNGQRELVAYCVLAEERPLEGLAAAAAEQLGARRAPTRYVAMQALPRRADGAVDRTALAAIAIPDLESASNCEEQLRAIPGVVDAAVLIQRKQEPEVLLQVRDLLPDWETTGEQPESAASERVTPDVSQRPFAYANGGELQVPPGSPTTMIEALLRTVETFPERGIVFVDLDGSETFTRYPELLTAAQKVLGGLRELGLKPGDSVILQLDKLKDHLPAFWGCALGGIIPVAIAIAPSYTPGNSVVGKLHNTWKLLSRPAILASREVGQSLRALAEQMPMEGLKILDFDRIKTHSPAREYHRPSPHDVLFYQLSSGSTGTPKCIQETHYSIIRHIQHSQLFNGYCSEDCSFNWLPMDHVVPILTYHLKDVYIGCNQVEAPPPVVLGEPLKWLDLMEKHRVTHSWAPNFGFMLLATALDRADGRHWDLSSLKFLMNAGEQVTLPVVRRFLERVAGFGVAPRVMQPAFGMAEVCTCMTYTNDFSLETGILFVKKWSLGGDLVFSDKEEVDSISFVDLGPPSPGVEIRITDEHNQMVKEGVVGRFQIRAGLVTPGYYKNDEANREAFVGDGWFNTGDIGFIWRGHLVLTGREKEMIIVNGANYYCYEVEDVVSGVSGVTPTYVAAVGISDPERGTEGLAIFYSPQGKLEDLDLIRKVRTQVTAALGISPSHVIPVPLAEFPKTTSGKIQRTKLKKALEKGDFDELIQRIEPRSDAKSTLPDWFFEVRWAARAARESGKGLPPGSYLVLADGGGVATRLERELEAQQLPCVRVQTGAKYARVTATQYRVDPEQPADFQRLFEDLHAEGIRIQHVVHLWAYQAGRRAIASLEELKARQWLGAYSLLSIAQQLQSEVEAPGPRRIFSFFGGTTEDASQDEVGSFAEGSLQGLLTTLAQEIPNLVVRGVRLPLASDDHNGERILTELRAPEGDVEVAYRGDVRCVAKITKLDLTSFEKRPLPLTEGKVCLLSGGLGGVGLVVAEYLAQRVRARLLILGQSPIDGAEGEPKLVRRRAAYERLRATGADVLYVTGDVSRPADVEAAIAQSRARWGEEPSIVFHLAGVMPERPIVRESPESFAQTLAPKAFGAWVLHSALKHRPDTVFVHFGSVNAHFGGATVAAYAAANALLDRFAQYQRSEGYQSYCLSFSMWDGLGISEGLETKPLALSRGYRSILPEQGLVSLLAMMRAGVSQGLIGLDGRNRHILAQSSLAAHTAEELVAYVEGEPGGGSNFAPPQLQDAFGSALEYRTEWVSALPRTADGDVDRAALLESHDSRSSGNSAYVGPSNAIEEVVARIAAEVLGRERLSVHDNFFEIGGQSLLLTQLVSRIRKVFQIDLQLPVVFKHPTVAGISTALVELESKPNQVLALAELQKKVAEMSPAEVERWLRAKKQQANAAIGPS